jgi:glycosyltransferase involved in cell wall biosynthesis
MGISRVEGEIARRLLANPDLRPIPVVFRDDGLLAAVGPSDVTRIFAAKPRTEARDPRVSRHRDRTPPKPTTSRVSPQALRLRQQAAASLRHVARAGVARLPDALREDVRAILIHSRQILRAAVNRNASASASPSPATDPVLSEDMLPALRMIVYPGPGDVLWTAGLYSNFVPLRTIAEMRANTGLAVVSTCHDLIRVTHPEFNPASMGTNLFVADAAALLDASDLVLAVSDATRRALLDFAERCGRAAPAVEILRLGSDFAARQVPSEPGVPYDIPRRSFALAVGTVERRKNYGLLVRIWERLAADPAFTLDLVIVGRLAFEAEESAVEIESSPLFGSRIRWLQHCPDAMLRHLYEQCHFVLYPSFMEGWGLPIAEALSFGRHVIASDQGALPEAGRGLAHLIDPTDEAGWTSAIADAAAAPRRTIVPPDSPTWDEAAAAVAVALNRCANLARAA